MSNSIITPEQLAEWKSTGIIDNYQGEILDIGNEKGWKKDSLTIKKCPNLKYLDAHNCDLKVITVSCPNLEKLLLNHNQLGYLIGLNRLVNLVRLEVTGNKLKTLIDLGKCVNLLESFQELKKFAKKDFKNLTREVQLFYFFTIR